MEEEPWHRDGMAGERLRALFVAELPGKGIVAQQTGTIVAKLRVVCPPC